MFKLHTHFTPQGDQPGAIDELISGIYSNTNPQTLLGVTGSGKTFTIARVISSVNLPVLVLSPNKTLAAQLYGEFKDFFPENRVEFFISYYDYYQPEAYIPQTDTYIEKDASINEDIDRLRHSTLQSLTERSDVIVVASVSAIYGLDIPEAYRDQAIVLREKDIFPIQDLQRKLLTLGYQRNDLDLSRGKYRRKGEIFEIYTSSSEAPLRLTYFDEEIEKIQEVDYITGKPLRRYMNYVIYPAKYFVTEKSRIEKAISSIKTEFEEHYRFLVNNGKLLEAQRIKQRTEYDMEMMLQTSYCQGVENYSLHLSGRKPGEKPYTLLDYFPKEFLLVIDESHQSIPQLRAMYKGDKSRKETLINFGFRLPSALDNRPLKFEELTTYMKKVIFVSATPGPYEVANSQEIVEQIIRPTGLTDPSVIIRPVEGQVDDLLGEVHECTKRNERALVLVLTKKLAENLAEYLAELGIKARYLHSDIKTIERVDILKSLREGEIDVLVGINLLREGLDLPEVSLVAILDADKEGFLRSERSLIQIMGRASRNINGRVIIYADKLTNSLQKAIFETNRRRQIQEKYNQENGISPQSIIKVVKDILEVIRTRKEDDQILYSYDPEQLELIIMHLEEEMKVKAQELEFEEAAEIRDRIMELKNKLRRIK
ncbi:MAG: UvrABC system protein B [candidate division WS2 bacterium]|uniref:UvrABC system protein B n=1 Tax=Psychracetigena formicireducens TaxID=2986056 RepID=A0A9E2BF37_PSYF1|nr:UvrABC system protein B [Candidatus Psychracetigena formicireducens]MBT9144453.1 UvrABC system protein B [Candidatus Psychracetigena formicireducens]MBT9150383.1 UvrABC system protein B [Candidatus Psychracetigena formicireducens]